MSTIFSYELSPSLLLRVRKPGHNTSGSVLLQDDGVLLECVECKEFSFQKYTELGWQEEYVRLYGGVDVSRVVKENNDDTYCQFYAKLHSSTTVVNTNQCKLSEGEFEAVHFAWNHIDYTLELQVIEQIEGNKCTIEHTEFTSLLMRFEPVVFAEPAVGLKRQLSWMA